MPWIWILLWVFLVAIVAVVAYDLFQTRHAILRNFPIIGHFRYLLESVGPELRQYIVTSNDEERPFSRDERRWIYASAKRQNNYSGFGTDNEIERSSNYLIIKHHTLGPSVPPDHSDDYPLPCAKVLGGARGRRKAFRPRSVVGVSGMSFGSLSAPAIEALNRGSAICGCLHNTGEGGISPHHLHGGELIWQLGTGYFGARASDGGFDKAEFLRKVEAHPVRGGGDQAEPGSQARPGRGASRREGDSRDLAHPRMSPRADGDQPAGASHLRDGGPDARFRRGAGGRVRAPRGGSSPPWGRSSSGRSWRIAWLRRTVASTSSPSTEVRVGRARPPLRSVTTSLSPSRSGSAASTGSSPSVAFTTTWSGSARASSACRRRRCWRSAWART